MLSNRTEDSILPLVADTVGEIYDSIQRICNPKDLDSASGCHATLIGAHMVEQDKRLLIISELARISVTEHATETILHKLLACLVEMLSLIHI